MHSQKRNSLLLAGLIAALLLPVLVFAQDRDIAGDFTLMSLDGKEVSLSDYRGKVVLLNFWATWCPPCRKEIPHFVEMVNEYEDKGLVILGIAADRGGEQVVREWVAKNNLNYPILMFTQDVYQKYQGYLPASQRGGIPFTFIIDREGRLRHRLVGYRDKPSWIELVTPLLNAEYHGGDESSTKAGSQ